MLNKFQKKSANSQQSKIPIFADVSHLLRKPSLKKKMIQIEVVLVRQGFIGLTLFLSFAVTCCLVRLSFHLLKSLGEKGHE